MNYTESEEYQREIREQYRARVKKFAPVDVVGILKTLGIDVADGDLQIATHGNVNATYLGSDIVVKINENQGTADYAGYLPVSALSMKHPVPRVFVYDNFGKTKYEVLVTNRLVGHTLIDTILELDVTTQMKLFIQLLDVLDGLFTLQFEKIGDFRNQKLFSTYRAYLEHALTESVSQIKNKNIWDSGEIDQVVAYVQKHMAVFDDETECTFVHEDLQMGNILHEGDRLTGLIDFDGAFHGPRIHGLLPLLGFIFNPQQFVEGTPYFEKFKGKQFLHFLPLLKQRWPKVFDDPQLLRKLNIGGIIMNLGWVADDWSKEWNKQLLGMFFTTEIDKDLRKSYYGQLMESGRYIQ